MSPKPLQLGSTATPVAEPVAESVYGIVVNVERFSDGTASAEVAMVYGPMLPPDVAKLLRVAATKLERESVGTRVGRLLQ